MLLSSFLSLETLEELQPCQRWASTDFFEYEYYPSEYQYQYEYEYQQNRTRVRVLRVLRPPLNRAKSLAVPPLWSMLSLIDHRSEGWSSGTTDKVGEYLQLFRLLSFITPSVGFTNDTVSRIWTALTMIFPLSYSIHRLLLLQNPRQNQASTSRAK